MKRKVVAMLLTGAMASSLFAGCIEAGAASDEETVVLKWCAGTANIPDDNEKELVLAEANKILEEKIGVTLEMEWMDFMEIGEKMTMYMASGEEWDLCYTSNWSNLYEPAVEKGGLLELSSLIDENAPALKETIDDFFWEGVKVDGGIYAVPNMQIVANSMCYVVQKELADKYGLDPESVKSVTDFEDFLAQIKENEPNLIPFRAHSGPVEWTWSTDSMLTEYTASECGVLFSDEEIVAKIDAGYEELLAGQKAMRDWFDKGYIRTDYLSHGGDNQDKGGRYAVYEENYKPGVETDIETQYGIDVYVIPATMPMVSGSSLTATLTGINAQSKHPEKAIQLIELMNTDAELYNLLSYGIKDKHYTLDENGQMTKIENSGYDPNCDWALGNTNLGYTMAGQDLNLREQVVEMNSNAYVSRLNGFTFDDTSVEVEAAAIQQIKDEYKGAYLYAEDIDALNEEIMQKYKDAGIEKVCEELNRQIQEFLNK